VVVLVYILLFVVLEPPPKPRNPRSSGGGGFSFCGKAPVDDLKLVADIDEDDPADDQDEEGKRRKGGRPTTLKKTLVISDHRMCFPPWTEDEMKECDVRKLVEEIMYNYCLLFVIHYYSVICSIIIQLSPINIIHFYSLCVVLISMVRVVWT
jgi:hypothetical protein